MMCDNITLGTPVVYSICIQLYMYMQPDEGVQMSFSFKIVNQLSAHSSCSLRCQSSAYCSQLAIVVLYSIRVLSIVASLLLQYFTVSGFWLLQLACYCSTLQYQSSVYCSLECIYNTNCSIRALPSVPHSGTCSSFQCQDSTYFSQHFVVLGAGALSIVHMQLIVSFLVSGLIQYSVIGL